ncbi:UDP-N-acetylmuramoyl-L-alanine--D-glutamate ligase [Balneatrix alpica]|uniref:UDP-N-acetylmuramoylalanine--D-glutamate ligase n=1 Tax=Balneatrix alpica TaxID=75684 RepID=A0ABV5ZC76_9GAMM|nr:UDP-N-acetylmuramoyl-L-alanine--D-glutamate ligase [Balneatrix alpica]
MQQIGSDQLVIVVGLGKTGLSCVRFLRQRGKRVAVVDTRSQPPGLAELQAEFPDVPYELGGLQVETLKMASELVVSPGLALSTPEIAAAIASGVQVVGDIELFCREAKAPIVAITGSNAKSTVTTLVGLMAEQAGRRVAVGGNLGTPALQLPLEDIDLYVLELSSFQLETTHSLRAEVATVLNISPDHMDRYPNLQAYHAAKHRIFRGCRQVVVNKDDVLSRPLVADALPHWYFSLGPSDLDTFGLERDEQGHSWLAYRKQRLLPTSSLKIRGLHNQANALAALALGHSVGLPMEAMLATLREFAGLTHRCQWVRERQGVLYFNDSKGTNVGATLAALQGLGGDLSGKIVLIAGGDGKGADFIELAPPLATYGRALVVIGRDAEKIAAHAGDLAVVRATSMQEAVEQAAMLAQPGDAVLLSPACASFDMFNHFEHRGEVFMQAVQELPA